MRVEPYSQMNIDSLFDDFVNAAKAMRHVLTLPQSDPQREAQKSEFMAIGAELRSRRPIQRLRELFDHEDDDVRTFAAAQFVTVDEEWALATMGAVTERLATHQVVELCARALRGPTVLA